MTGNTKKVTPPHIHREVKIISRDIIVEIYDALRVVFNTCCITIIYTHPTIILHPLCCTSNDQITPPPPHHHHHHHQSPAGRYKHTTPHTHAQLPHLHSNNKRHRERDKTLLEEERERGGIEAHGDNEQAHDGREEDRKYLKMTSTMGMKANQEQQHDTTNNNDEREYHYRV